jgi:hypothetical protein
MEDGVINFQVFQLKMRNGRKTNREKETPRTNIHTFNRKFTRMLHSPRAVAVNEETPAARTFQYVLFNNILKRNQWYDELLGSKARLDRTAPNMQQVIHADMERMKTNKVYDRKLNRDLNGPKGLSWQCK